MASEREGVVSPVQVETELCLEPPPPQPLKGQGPGCCRVTYLRRGWGTAKRLVNSQHQTVRGAGSKWRGQRQLQTILLQEVFSLLSPL